MGSPLIRRRRVLAAATESAAGTAETLTGSNAAFNVFDLSIEPDVEMSSRPAQGSFSQLASIPGRRMCTVKFRLEMCGSGATGGAEPAWASVFLPSCGLVESSGDMYVLSSLPPEAAGSATKTITLAGYYDGQERLAFGCMGNVVFTLEAGKVVSAEFTYKGIYGGVTDVAILTPTYPTVIPPRFSNTSSLTIGSVTPRISSLKIDLGNEVTVREDATTVTGLLAAVITNRKVTGSIDPEAALVADYDPFGDWIAGTARALTATVGSVANNTQVYTMPAVQLIKPTDGERGGLQADTWDFQANRSSADDDELTINFN